LVQSINYHCINNAYIKVNLV